MQVPVGSELARNDKVDMVSFTGDVNTGKEIARLATCNLKKVTLEVGGKSPNIIFSDSNLEAAAKEAVSGAGLYHAGRQLLRRHKNLG